MARKSLEKLLEDQKKLNDRVKKATDDFHKKMGKYIYDTFEIYDYDSFLDLMKKLDKVEKSSENLKTEEVKKVEPYKAGFNDPKNSQNKQGINSTPVSNQNGYNKK